MQSQAKNLRNPSPRELGSECDDGQAMGKKSAGEAEANPGKFREAALQSARCERGSRDMETRKPDALRTENEGGYWDTTPAYASAGRRTLTPFERSEVLRAECGFKDE